MLAIKSLVFQIILQAQEMSGAKFWDWSLTPYPIYFGGCLWSKTLPLCHPVRSDCSLMLQGTLQEESPDNQASGSQSPRLAESSPTLTNSF